MKHDFWSCEEEVRLDRPRVSRRAVLACGMAGLISWMAPTTAISQIAMDPKRSRNDVVVVLFLRGGADGLAMVAPIEDDNYRKSRPTLAMSKADAKPLDSNFALSPQLSMLHKYWEQKQMAIVHACGSGDQTRSHFEAMRAMEQGRNNSNELEGGGWIARHLAVTPGASSPFRAVALESVLPESLTGSTSALAIDSLDQFRLKDRSEAYRRAMTSLYGGPTDVLGRAGKETLAMLKALDAKNPSDSPPENGATYGENGLAQALRQVAYLIRQDIGMEVACVSSYGWDSHVVQAQILGVLLPDLGNALDAFMTDLGPEMKRVTVIVQTEFGRQLYENSGFGTDHGRGGCLFAFGAGVKGGKVYGDWPGLTPEDLDDAGDVRVKNDYRDVFSEVLASRLGNPAVNDVFPGRSGAHLGICG
ncbi:MAG: DUF1501 domain-containing protein [Fimbriimonadaceae bacterium]|nr:DUF1501 domain-containing protein [Fimbriimonadaceae bacterium]